MEPDLDLEQATILPPPPSKENPSKTAALVRSQVRRVLGSEYKREVTELMRARSKWKKGGDWCEAAAKGLTGISSVFAFAASSNVSAQVTDILAFVSGCIGTLGLVLLTYSTYAIRESRQRGSELNGVLQTLDVTPMPEISGFDPNPEN